jgi:hippurate hydrolase
MMPENIPKGLWALKDAAIGWRHDFHMHPEIAFQERRTSTKIAELLRSWGLQVTEGIAETGVVGTLSVGQGPAVALRSDIDALPMTEENGFAHQSRKSGVMHACGHDGHMAMLLAAARYLSQTKQFQGTIHFIFQPAEENEAGAKAMIDDGLFERFDAQAVFGMHNWPGLNVGAMEVCSGPIMAAFDIFDININCQGAHAAMPHLGQDAALAASQLVGNLQAIVSRRIDPISPAVVSVTEMRGGDTYNILPSAFRISGCTRHFDNETQTSIEAEMFRLCDGLALANDVKIVMEYQRRYPATINSQAETEIAANAATYVVGAERFSSVAQPSLSSEDFAFMLNERPGCYIRLGNGSTKNGCTLHSPTYDFCDDALIYGAAYWIKLAATALSAIK